MSSLSAPEKLPCWLSRAGRNVIWGLYIAVHSYLHGSHTHQLAAMCGLERFLRNLVARRKTNFCVKIVGKDFRNRSAHGYGDRHMCCFSTTTLWSTSNLLRGYFTATGPRGLRHLLSQTLFDHKSDHSQHESLPRGRTIYAIYPLSKG